MSSQVVVITFDDPDEAEQVRETIRTGEKGGYISLDDAAVVVKDEDGKVHVKNETDRGVAVGALGGGLLGLLIFSMFTPIGAIVLGALGGAFIGKAVKPGVDKKFEEDIVKALTPGSSAIFLVVKDANADYAIAALREYKGTIYQTSLSEEAEESLRAALK